MGAGTVETSSGPVHGVRVGGTVQFRGLPYARAARHRPPEPPVPWTAPRGCRNYGPACPQLQLGPPNGVLASMQVSGAMDEDCLTLNVATPSLEGSLPVMVWLHGGAFVAGTSSSTVYDLSALAGDGVVAVSVNYRLHALGFLDLEDLFPDMAGSGNAGLLDQMTALRWVRDNIAAFGGDPGNVTIFGESSGGMSVGALLAAPAAKGLFHRAIAQSGAAHHALAREVSDRVARTVLQRVGVAPGDRKALLSVPAAELAKTATMVAFMSGPELREGSPAANMLAFAPVIDGTTLAQRPDELVAAGSAAGVDLLVGTTAEEYRLFGYGLPPFYSVAPLPDLGPMVEPAGRRAADFLAVYGARRPREDARGLACAVLGDAVFTIPAIRLAEAQSAQDASVWMYRFAWRTPVLGGALGSCHALDIPFVFDTLDEARAFVGSEAPRGLAQLIRRAWVTFATTGDPNTADLPDWPPYRTDTRRVMFLDEEPAVREDPDAAERLLWAGAW